MPASTASPTNDRSAPPPSSRRVRAEFPARIRMTFASQSALKDFLAKATSDGGFRATTASGATMKIEL